MLSQRAVKPKTTIQPKFYCNWELDWPLDSYLHINSKEILAVYLAVCRWAPAWRNKRIYIQSDNMTTVATINRGTSRNTFIMGCLRILFWLSAHYNFHITAHFIKGLSNTVADNISRIHEPKQFHHLLPFICPTPLELHMSQTSHFFFLRSQCQTAADQHLGQEVSRLRQLTFAESTRCTYSCQLLLYLKFCASLNISPVPISQHSLGRYIAFISSKLSFSSVRQYLNFVRFLHLEVGYANPLLDNWYISSILIGMRRLKGDVSRQKLSITCQILQEY